MLMCMYMDMYYTGVDKVYSIYEMAYERGYNKNDDNYIQNDATDDFVKTNIQEPRERNLRDKAKKRKGVSTTTAATGTDMDDIDDL